MMRHYPWLLYAIVVLMHELIIMILILVCEMRCLAYPNCYELNVVNIQMLIKH